MDGILALRSPPMPGPNLSLLDRLLAEADHGLRVIAARSPASAEPSPAASVPEAELAAEARRHAGSLMRVNHSGEVCAQALYRGQALCSRSAEMRSDMSAAAQEEEAHLAWCQQRLDELGTEPSRFNPLWYGASFALGAAAGLAGAGLGLGFVAATEDQVCAHLRDHLGRLPAADERSRALVTKMLADEGAHAHRAKEAGAWRFPKPVKAGMTLISRIMTGLSYRA
jgi:ubiquinone biosynthesis monooxygenase Coq7